MRYTKRMNAPAWIVTGLAIAATGCSTAAPTVSDASNPTPQADTDRGVLADGPETNDDVLKSLPKRISETDARKILVQLPTERIQDDDRSTLQRGRGRGGGFRGGGFRGGGFRGGRSFRSFSYFPTRGLYYPYYLTAGYYYPYYYPYDDTYLYPYLYGYRSAYYPRYWRYRHRWW